MAKQHTCPSCGHHFIDSPPASPAVKLHTVKPKVKRGKSTGLACSTCKARIGHHDNCAAAAATRSVLLATAAEWAAQKAAGINIHLVDKSMLTPSLTQGRSIPDAIKEGLIHPYSNPGTQWGPDAVFTEAPSTERHWRYPRRLSIVPSSSSDSNDG